ncbi:hypothetical protein V5P93_005163 [Actinokineospora auranticolor]|uniref:Uncharacterized protein n=1 Tax=Actinokineospora auranticolor TaxID=155976 RepID=A0A2S6GKD1_9PSEU|nr:hypothetical protein [Actinokineospora auranticolor]PPK65694.1 hypothetical protein CLV40_113178 [Actinokineospora auranticolor]
MATWTDVINYVRTRYEVLQDTDGWLRFRLDTEGERSQQVAVHHITAEDGDWVEISSPVGRADDIDLRALLTAAATDPIGAAAVVDGVALLKHAAPLADRGVGVEFGGPLTRLVTRADALERELTSADAF